MMKHVNSRPSRLLCIKRIGGVYRVRLFRTKGAGFVLTGTLIESLGLLHTYASSIYENPSVDISEEVF